MTAPAVLPPVARHFAALLKRLAPSEPAVVQELALRLLAAGEGGDSCLDLGREPEWPQLRNLLRASQLVGEPGMWRPLILDSGGRLYLHRRWQEEETVANELRRRGLEVVDGIDALRLQDGLARFFGAEVDGEQALAARAAVERHLCVINGGPGTGKTTTVVRVLALLLEQHGVGLRVALTAPTGKAAARLSTAIVQTRAALDCAETVRAAIPAQTQTLHRLLGAGRRPGTFRFGAGQPLPLDVVVVDEASMVDLSLMSVLLAALPPQARLLLLGDRDQLASVEAGAVLADLCAVPPVPGPERAPLAAAIQTLHHSRRFASEGGIGAVCRAVNRGAGEEALALLQGEAPVLAWRDLPEPAELGPALTAEIVAGFTPLLSAATPATALARLADFTLLCALRQGPYGAPALNQLIERLLARHALIAPRGSWYAGQPLMIVRNDPQLELFNGDLGIVLADPPGGALRAFFAAPDGGVRSFSPLRLPPHETAFAMTVHKSQGSEFERIMLLLPPQESEVVSRELIYTGLSRARSSLTVWGRAAMFIGGVARQTERRSGLRARLWGE